MSTCRDLDSHRCELAHLEGLEDAPSMVRGGVLWQDYTVSTDRPADVLKIRVKLEAQEFEAEGPHEIVAAHFRTWQQLIGADHRLAAPAAASTATLAATPDDLFALDPRRDLVTFRHAPDGALARADAALLLLYGFHQFLSPPGRAVLVTRLKAALTASGYPQGRIDRTLQRHLAAGLAGKRGRRIGSTYHLTSAGLQHAKTLLQQVLKRRAPSA